MIPRPVSIVILALAAAGPLSAQHAEGDPTIQAGEAQGCVLCHGGHTGGAGYGLRVDGVPGTDVQAPGLGNTSRSCLRCHSTATQRDRQPEFRGRFSDRGTERFLGLDLGDDHPLGRIEQGGATASLNAWGANPQAYSFDVTAPGYAGGPDAVECTLCHDPHDRAGALPDLLEQREICSACHDPTLFLDLAHPDLACTDCHRLHGGRPGDLLASEPDSRQTCLLCHDPSGDQGWDQSFDQRPAELDPSARGMGAPRAHLPPKGGDCVDCHHQHR
jgi:predicted CXXCH cytochrome family protein